MRPAALALLLALLSALLPACRSRTPGPAPGGRFSATGAIETGSADFSGELPPGSFNIGWDAPCMRRTGSDGFVAGTSFGVVRAGFDSGGADRAGSTSAFMSIQENPGHCPLPGGTGLCSFNG